MTSDIAETASHTLPEREWKQLEAEHLSVLNPIIGDFQQRRQRHIRQPVIDFLFEYYQCNRKWLSDWRPGLDVVLAGQKAEKFLGDPRYYKTERGVTLDPLQIDEKTKERAKWVELLLKSTRAKPLQFNCFGLHEWAMVYKSKQIRHEKTPLRVSMEDVTKIVDSHPIRCSHYDAFRFFTTEARPLNCLNPGLETRAENEQFACLHFNMDLYKWCYKLAPWTSSELTRDCFLHAVSAREIDMRASPYDVRHLNLQPILIETPDGKREYQAAQEALSQRGLNLSKRLLAETEKILNS